jgi:hypothetical protein
VRHAFIGLAEDGGRVVEPDGKDNRAIGAHNREVHLFESVEIRRLGRKARHVAGARAIVDDRVQMIISWGSQGWAAAIVGLLAGGPRRRRIVLVPCSAHVGRT